MEFGFELRRSVRVADHGRLQKRLGKLIERLPALQCSHIVMTRKDACRLPDWNDNEPLLVLEQRLEIEAIDNLLQRLLPTAYWSASSAIVTDVDPEKR
jgi:tetraacyldisaccharide-1-P 4'-kinase